MLLFALFLFGLDVRQARADDDRFDGALVTVAKGVEPWDGASLAIDLQYMHPVTGEVVRATTYLQNPAVVPTSPTFAIDVARDDPRAVRLVDDRRSGTDELPLYAVGVLVAAAFAVSRWWHVRRTEALARGATTTYAMLGCAVPPVGVHRRWRLFLYPVDAGPGAESVCGLTLVTVPSIPTGVFPVEVKGSPRPYGAVAARADGELLWTRGRALGRSAFDRPTRRGDVLPAVPMPSDVPVGGFPPASVPRVLVLAGVLLAATSQWAVVGYTQEVRAVFERSRPITASIVAVDDDPSAVTARITFPLDGSLRETDYDVHGEALAVGTSFAARVDSTDPSVVWRPGVDSAPTHGVEGRIQLVAALFPVLLYLAARLRSSRAETIGAHELLTAGRIEEGTPPVSSGLVVWDGVLQLRVDMSRNGWWPWVRLGGDAASMSLRFEPDGLATDTTSAGELAWASGFPSSPVAGTGPWWWLRSRTSVLEVVRSSVPVGDDVDPVRGPASSDPFVAVRSAGGLPDSDLRALAHHLCTTPAARNALADPPRLVGFVAAVTWQRTRRPRRDGSQPRADAWPLRLLTG